jgi:hypothetical protein
VIAVHCTVSTCDRGDSCLVDAYVGEVEEAPATGEHRLEDRLLHGGQRLVADRRGTELVVFAVDGNQPHQITTNPDRRLDVDAHPGKRVCRRKPGGGERVVVRHRPDDPLGPQWLTGGAAQDRESRGRPATWASAPPP